MKKKKLFILIWNLGIGGVQKRLRDIILDLDANYPNVESHLLVEYNQESPFVQQIISTGTQVHIFAEARRKGMTLPFFSWVLKKYYLINPDICLTFLDYLSIIMVICREIFFWRKTSLVLNEAASTTKYISFNHSHIWGLFIKFFYQFADKIIVPTQAGKEDLVQNYAISSKKIIVINNWTLLRPQYSEAKKQYDLAFIGRLDPEKNPLSVLKIVASIKPNLPAISVAIAGHGKLFDEMRANANNLGLSGNIHFLGLQNDISRTLKQTKVLLLPSLNEGLPNVVLEAAMFCVPTVASNFPGVTEVIIEANTGYICRSQVEMVNRILELLQDANLRRKYGQQARKFVQKNFTYKNQQKFIEEVLS